MITRVITSATMIFSIDSWKQVDLVLHRQEFGREGGVERQGGSRKTARGRFPRG
jgi:hypothetical protein